MNQTFDCCDMTYFGAGGSSRAAMEATEWYRGESLWNCDRPRRMRREPLFSRMARALRREARQRTGTARMADRLVIAHKD